jgi:integrase
LGTGLRRGDIESLKISDLDFMRNCITTVSKKTGKSMGARPVPPSVMMEVRKFVNGYNSECGRLFSDKFSHKK